MPWTTSYLAQSGVVLTVYNGVVSPDSLWEAAKATLETAERHGTKKILADCTGLEGGHSVVDLYELARQAQASGLLVGWQEAVVLPRLPGPVDDVLFWETTCQNRGVPVQVFDSMDAAMEWLVADSATRDAG